MYTLACVLVFFLVTTFQAFLLLLYFLKNFKKQANKQPQTKSKGEVFSQLGKSAGVSSS